MQEESSICKNELILLDKSLCVFLESFHKASNCSQNLLSKPKVNLDLQIRTTMSLPITVKKSLNNQIDNIVYRFDLETVNLVPFYQKFERYGNFFELTEIVNLNLCESHHF